MKKLILLATSLISLFSFFSISNAWIDLIYWWNPQSLKVVNWNYDYIRNKQILSTWSTMVFFTDDWSYNSWNKLCVDLRLYNSWSTISYYCNWVNFYSWTYLNISWNNNLPLSTTFFNYFNYLVNPISSASASSLYEDNTTFTWSSTILFYQDNQWNYHFNNDYKFWQDFFFYWIFIVVIWVYLAFKIVRWIWNLFFNH